MIEFEDIDLGEMLDAEFSIVAEELNLSDAEDKQQSDTQKVFPILPVRNMVMFPNVVIPITAGREQSKKLLEEAQKNNNIIGIISQKNSNVENPEEHDLFKVGTLARIVKIIVLPEGNITAITKGIQRFKTKKFVSSSPYFLSLIHISEPTRPY